MGILAILTMLSFKVHASNDCLEVSRSFRSTSELIAPLSGRLIKPVEYALKNEELTVIGNIDFRSKTHKTTRLVRVGQTGYYAIRKLEDRHEVNSYEAEILAYELSELIGIDLVPPTVERTIDGLRYSLQLYIEHDRTEIPNAIEMAAQSFFDFLIHNRDRGERTNYLVGDSGKVVSIDHGLAFTDSYGNHDYSFEERSSEIIKFLSTNFGKSVIGELEKLILNEKFKKEASSYFGQTILNKLFERIDFLLRFNKILQKGKKFDSILEELISQKDLSNYQLEILSKSFISREALRPQLRSLISHRSFDKNTLKSLSQSYDSLSRPIKGMDYFFDQMILYSFSDGEILHFFIRNISRVDNSYPLPTSFLRHVLEFEGNKNRQAIKLLKMFQLKKLDDFSVRFVQEEILPLALKNDQVGLEYLSFLRSNWSYISNIESVKRDIKTIYFDRVDFKSGMERLEQLQISNSRI